LIFNDEKKGATPPPLILLFIIQLR